MLDIETVTDTHSIARLYAAAGIAAKLRKAVWEEVGFTCSAGISHNKMYVIIQNCYR